MEFPRHLFSSGGFQPHGFCYQWNTGLVWLNVLSDLLIALAYFGIPLILLRFIRKRKDLPFSWIFGLFGVFIIACGATHLMEVWNLWHAQYWLAGAIKTVTAAASVGTAALLVKVVPQALEIPSARQWKEANEALKKVVQEHESAEVELRLREASYREIAELLDLTHDAIFVRNLENEIVHWNEAAEKLYGWKVEEVRGRKTHDVLGTVFPKPREEIEATLFKDGYWEGELVHQLRRGGFAIVSSRWALRTDDHGKPAAILESNRDITQRKKADDELRLSEERFRLLVSGVRDYAIVTLDPEGYVTSWNTGAERIKGYSAEEVMGKHFSMFFSEEDIKQDKAGTELKIAIQQGRCEEEGWRVRKDGTHFWASVVVTALHNEKGRLYGFGKITRDITERKRAESALARKQEELAGSIAELNATNKELEAFSYSVSHDLRAPLRTIDGFSLALLEDYSDKLDAEGKKHLDRVRAATQKMGALIDDLLNLSRVTRANMRLEKVDVSSAAEEVIEELQKSQPGRRVECSIEKGLEAMADSHLLRVVLVNLLGNAWKFTSKRDSAHIEFGKTQNNGSSAFFVRDNGAGFDPAYADRLFGAFQRLHAMTEFPGTGIGLATVQRIINRHGGQIWAEGQAGQGATFYFTLQTVNP
ncbi:MAG: PAS domain S-box protein [Candidatus Acidiferrum sp.]|jgi:PAS domain S-box-containing protein